MATYQKRGYKKTIEIEEEIVVDEGGNLEHSTTAEVFNTLDETANKSEKWIEQNSKPLLIALAVSIVLIFGYMGYTQFIEIPTQKKAANALVYAKQEFTKATNGNDTEVFKRALNGTEGNVGLVEIATEYGSTEAGNLAKYYAGISYLNIKEYDNAIDYLTDVTTNDALLNSVIKGSIGDAYLAKNDTSEALDYYTEAADTSNNKAVAPVFLLKAGKLALELKEYNKAKELFASIQNDYATSKQAENIDLYINQAKYSN